MVKKTRVVLTNGFPLVVIEIPDSKSLVTSFWTKAGARFDPEGKAGMAHFMEHLLIKKTKNYPTDIELAQELEKVGAFKDGTTNKDWMTLHITSAKDDLELTTKILAEMVFNPYIDQDGLDKERKVIFQEIARKGSLPDDLIWDIWWRVFFKDTKMAIPTLGTEESLNKITLKDINNFWQKEASKTSNILVISGGVETKKVIKLAEKYFGKYKLQKKNVVPTFKYNHTQKIVIEKRLLPRANMLMSFTIPKIDIKADLHALIVLRNILLGGWSSRLYQRLRVQESLIYGSGARIMEYFDIAAFTILLASDKDSFPKMITILSEELVKLKEKGITNKELNRVKGFIKGTMLSSIETSSDYVNWYDYDELYYPENVETPEERIENIMKVKKEDVEKVAKNYLTQDNWLLAIVGDIKEESIKVKL